MMRKAHVSSDSIPIYLIPGMTSDFPVYSRILPMLPYAFVIDFIQPHPRETLVNYASRMASQLPSNSFIGGISFGGIVALEVARILRPRGCILISSIRHPRELPPSFRVGRLLGGRCCSSFLGMIGSAAAMLPKSVCKSTTIRVKKLAGTDGSWHRWATSAVIDWKPELAYDGFPVLQIHGSADRTFPIRYTHPDIVVPNGRHSLTISNPEGTANAIRAFTKATHLAL